MAIRHLRIPLAAALALLPALWPGRLPGAPYLVKDLNTVPVDERGRVDLEGQGIGPGVSYFAAADPAHGVELWRSDGTPGGTERLTELCAGPCSGNPRLMTVHAGRVFFTASDGYSGEELWVSDGTPGSERRVRDLCPGPCSAIAGPLQAVGDRLLFTPSFPDDSHGLELWQTDGTAQGTTRVSDLILGDLDDLDGEPSWASGLTVAGDRLFFTVYNETTGAELWTSTGNAAGTGLLTDLNPGPGSSSPQWLTAVGGVLLFAADDNLTGLEPWRTDGTAAGTVRIGDIAPGRDASSSGPFTAIDNVVITGADDGVHGREPWAIPRQDLVP